MARSVAENNSRQLWKEVRQLKKTVNPALPNVWIKKLSVKI